MALIPGAITAIHFIPFEALKHIVSASKDIMIRMEIHNSLIKDSQVFTVLSLG